MGNELDFTKGEDGAKYKPRSGKAARSIIPMPKLDAPTDLDPQSSVDYARQFYQRRAPMNAARLDWLAQHAESEPVRVAAITQMNDRAMGKPTQEIISRSPAGDAVLERIALALRQAAMEIDNKQALLYLDAHSTLADPIHEDQ